MLINNVRSRSIELQPTWHERGNRYLPRGLLRRHICQNHSTTITPDGSRSKDPNCGNKPQLEHVYHFYRFFANLSIFRLYLAEF